MIFGQMTRYHKYQYLHYCRFVKWLILFVVLSISYDLEWNHPDDIETLAFEIRTPYEQQNSFFLFHIHYTLNHYSSFEANIIAIISRRLLYNNLPHCLKNQRYEVSIKLFVNRFTNVQELSKNYEIISLTQDSCRCL